jgi:ABC-type Fe3+/spermidine/putrescine transport system ATPase subunit
VAFTLNHGKIKLPLSKVRYRVLSALELVQLAGLEERPAPFLSGGQQQRVALARALAVEPKVLLMDEPLSNLDARLREEVRDEIKSLARRLSITVLYVTHDQVEAMALADQLAVMSQGKILQIGPPQQLYDFPVSRKVAGFLGSMNEFDGILENNVLVRIDLGVLQCTAVDGITKEVIVAIRPEDLELSPQPTGLLNESPAQLLSQLFLGDATVYHLTVAGKRVHAKTTRPDRHLQPGGMIYIRFPAEKLKIFPR